MDLAPDFPRPRRRTSGEAALRVVRHHEVQARMRDVTCVDRTGQVGGGISDTRRWARAEHPSGGQSRDAPTVTAASSCTLLLAAVLLAGCGGGAEPAASKTDAAPSEAAPSSAAPVAACVPAPQDLLDAIAKNDRPGVEDITHAGGQMVKSPDHPDFYLIAARMAAPGVESDVGIWASDRLTPGGLILTVNDFAEALTFWSDGDEALEPILRTEPAVVAVRDCVT